MEFALTTPRLTLRPFRADDTPALFGILQEPDIMQYFPTPGTPDMARVERIVAGQIGAWETYGRTFWAMEWRETGDLIGWCGLQFLPQTQETEVGYLLARPYWGQGIATEAARRSVSYGFDDLALDAIIGITHPANTASQNVLRKAGLTFTGPAHYFGMDCYRFEKRQT
ncbi:MAG: GNAT family N-acetyltransferase [Caldilineaceae bacterium]